ncbi:hypothetical protein IJ818_06235 [bacterium]|nr:hypothetical protein [bacterium]
MRKKITNKKLVNKLRNIEIDAVAIAAILKIIRDSCEYNDYTNQEIVADIALKKQYQLIENVSSIY